MQRKTERLDRQLRVLGKHAQKQLSSSSILIVGLGGLGVEIAKDAILTGFKQVGIHDTKKITHFDLGTQFYCKESDIGKKSRLEGSIEELQSLNEYCVISNESSLPLDITLFKKYDVVIFSENHISNLREENEICRKNNIHFIAGDCRGLFGSIFVDFGEKFKCVDTTGEKPASGIITDVKIDDKENLVIYTKDPENIVVPNVSNGDVIKLFGLVGLEELNGKELTIVNRLDAFTFNLGPFKGKGKYISGGRYVQVVQSKEIKFKSLKESLELKEKESNFLFYDYSKLEFPSQMQILFHALAEYEKKFSELPKSFCEEDHEKLLKVASEISSIKLNEVLSRAISFTCRGNINPMVTFIGGLIAQEAQKAVTGKFHPIHQWFRFESLNCLPPDFFSKSVKFDMSDYEPQKSRYDSQIAVFGKKFQKLLGNLKYFLVGCGALGCEYSKNFAMCGVSCGENGKLIITDMDEIETSNLSRQFLFRNRHVGKMKSECAGEVIKLMNPNIKVKAMQDRVGAETENVFNDSFWEGLDGIMNALDNLQARRYVDSRSVLYKRPLFESGTLGTKAHTQVIVPKITVNYSAQRDVETNEFPECTIHVYPNVIEHCIAWSKRLFSSTFFSAASDVNLFLKQRKKYEEKNGFNLMALEGLHEMLIKESVSEWKDCIVIARKRFEKLFHFAIKDLLQMNPPDKKTKSGGPFWSGNKRCPSPITKFELSDTVHFAFLKSLSLLYARCYGLKVDSKLANDMDVYKRVLDELKLPKFVPRLIEDEDEDEEGKKKSEEEILAIEKKEKEGLERDRAHMKLIRSELEVKEKANAFKDMELLVMEFEKNEELHIEFVTAAGNLRARCYKIPEIDEHQTKGIAGNIIPAMITTTAIATGLMMFELFKYHQNHGIEKFSNGFLNIGIPVLLLNNPKPPQKKFLNQYTVWDKVLIRTGKDLSLKAIMNKVEKDYGVKVASIAFGQYPIFIPTLSDNQKAYRLKYPLLKLTEGLIKGKIEKKYICYTIIVEKDGKNHEFLPLVYTIDKRLAALEKKKRLMAKRKKKLKQKKQ